ncbi:hypothetical protein V2J94_42265 [Streptomyces sp. DSM 41524]|uniref:Ricin B lectin domain-containing protein n=1 Tax=Streptomyces asiaticus subsp. ignotus TaxID=3098222 RepID=A0ABU7QAU2_9ACTN|nr:hypothetical protein [Streptomyces sp. DASNCL29]MEE4598390.1 hypothetical protein [Streptomyces sp. DSM 41524]
MKGTKRGAAIVGALLLGGLTVGAAPAGASQAPRAAAAYDTHWQLAYNDEAECKAALQEHVAQGHIIKQTCHLDTFRQYIFAWQEPAGRGNHLHTQTNYSMESCLDNQRGDAENHDIDKPCAYNPVTFKFDYVWSERG